MRLRDVLLAIESGEPFSITWVKADGKLRAVKGLTSKKKGQLKMGRYANPYLNLFHPQELRYYKIRKRLIVKFNGKMVNY